MTLAAQLRQSIDVSAHERDAGTLSPANRALAAVILRCRGYVILKDVIDPELVETLRRTFAPIYQDCRETPGAVETGTAVDAPLRWHVSRRTQATFWFRKSRWRIFPRLIPPISDPALLANPFVVSLLEELLGADFRLQFVSTDTCTQGSILQAPHSDIGRDGIIADNRWRLRGVVVNVPLVESGLHNGALEVWPGGSHMWTADLFAPQVTLDIQDAANPSVERFAAYFPSITLSLHPGEILIRDLAMWHRGTPNRTDEPRTMFTLGYFRRDYSYGYADIAFNVDEALFRNLHPRIQRMYAPYFSLGNRLRRRQQRMRSAAKRTIRVWLGPQNGR